MIFSESSSKVCLPSSFMFSPDYWNDKLWFILLKYDIGFAVSLHLRSASLNLENTVFVILNNEIRMFNDILKVEMLLFHCFYWDPDPHPDPHKNCRSKSGSLKPESCRSGSGSGSSTLIFFNKISVYVVKYLRYPSFCLYIKSFEVFFDESKI